MGKTFVFVLTICYYQRKLNEKLMILYTQHIKWYEELNELSDISLNLCILLSGTYWDGAKGLKIEMCSQNVIYFYLKYYELSVLSGMP